MSLKQACHCARVATVRTAHRPFLLMLSAGLIFASAGMMDGCATSTHTRTPQTVLIETSPAGAAAFFDETFQCTTPCQIALSRAGTATQLVLKKEGFENRSFKVDTVAAGTAGPNLAAAVGSLFNWRLEPVAHYVPRYRFALRPLSEPADAAQSQQPPWLRVDVDGAPAGSWTDLGQNRNSKPLK